jgi:hypothetical protein
MEKSLGSLKLDDEHSFLSESQSSFRCTGCNVVFQKPILATVSAHGSVNRYYACPRCLSKIREVKKHEDEEDEDEEEDGKVSIGMEKVKFAVAKHGDSVDCKHFLGYLKKRSKEAPIPDDCLTCDKMIECMMR